MAQKYVFARSKNDFKNLIEIKDERLLFKEHEYAGY